MSNFDVGPEPVIAPENYTWLVNKFKEVIDWDPTCTVEEGMIYGIVTLWRDIEPGSPEGEINLYEVLMDHNLLGMAKRNGFARSTLYRRLNDVRGLQRGG